MSTAIKPCLCATTGLDALNGSIDIGCFQRNCMGLAFVGLFELDTTLSFEKQQDYETFTCSLFFYLLPRDFIPNCKEYNLAHGPRDEVRRNQQVSRR